uniref:Titin n=1 Tax=Mesocestoides corti TaxID=53468 RepID=A0A5K3EL91_MESCO
MSDREDSSTQSSSEFSDNFPSTTTISTIAVQAGQSKIILAVLRCGAWIKVRIQCMEPDLYDIGSSCTSVEVRGLLEQHATLVSKLAAKQEHISELLTRAEEMVSQQPTEGQARVYSAMSASLNKAWRELLDVLGNRGHLLHLVVECFENAENVHAAVARIIEASTSGEWGDSVESVKRLIEEHEALKQMELLQPSQGMLEAANGAIDLLTRMAARTGQTPESGLSRTSAETRERIAAVTGDANEARRLAETAWERRARLLQLRLTVVRLETEHEQVVDWFAKVGEPQLAAALSGSSLQECKAAMEALVSLAADAREYQHVNSRLVRQAQQLSLPRGESDAESDMLMQSAHRDLVNRFATSEKYIWEFMDRIESRRRCLQASIIFFSEAKVLLENLGILEREIDAAKSRQEIRVDLFQRLTELEMRVPGLREILIDLRSRVDERPSAASLNLTPTVPLGRPVSPLTSSADAAMSANLNEIDETIKRCRMACSGLVERDAKDRQLREIDNNLTALWRWTEETIHRVLETNQSPGTTISSVSDFEDLHRRLDRQMTSHDHQLSNLQTLISSLPASAEKQSFQQRLDEITEIWTRYRRTITIRLRTANELSRLLKRIREDECYYLAVNDRLKSMATGIPLLQGHVNLHESQPLKEGEIARIQADLMDVQSRLESQQEALKQALEELSREGDKAIINKETQNFYRSQIQLNIERLSHLQEQLNNVQSTRQIWLSWSDKWNDFTNSARKLDEAIANSRARMARTPLPRSGPAAEAALAEHTRDGEHITQLIAEVNAKANTLASLVGAEPAGADAPSRVRRYTEVPYATPGPGEIELAKSVRSELCVATVGLEQRSSDWENIYCARKHALEEQISRTTELDTLERDLQEAETELRRIIFTVNLETPLPQVEHAYESLHNLELRIPELQGRVRSTAFLPGMKPVRAPSDLLEISSPDVTTLEEKHEQLDSRVSNLAAEAAKCRSEINLTLQLLRAVRDAENQLTSLTMELSRSSDQLRHLAPDDQMQMRQLVSDLETQLDNVEQYAQQHVPQLQALAEQFPGDDARKKVQPIVARFRDSAQAMSELAQNVRVRSEQFVDLVRLQGPLVQAVETIRSHQMVTPQPGPPKILKPLPNMHVAEGTRVILDTTFDAGIPQGYSMAVDIEGTWYKDGIPVTSPDYRTKMDHHSASLEIEETFGD